ncbi:uncharacterized protein LOC110118452 [Ceratitis capitata]|uniref:(Mediterranean fruit fly) hypothetical protein n=1 Tax=Ceratitis capitata TaxID=7213 RepID=A0A811U599_CERCA|nr:uncharacterized protein LOC110118452 [Ceratitis capitata]CAD6994164.1 unnamed protein product [Ceratitis capitata]
MDSSKSLSANDNSNQYRYISHVDFISILRDKYKEGTKHAFEEIKAQVEQECEEKKHRAEKASVLLKHCRDTLQQLDEQHFIVERMLQKHVELGKTLTHQIRQRTQMLNENEMAIRHLLQELRQNKT